MTTPALYLDSGDSRRTLSGADSFRPWNDLAVLTSADIHVATRLGRLAGETSEEALLAVALAVRALRLGHVCVDLSTVAARATSEIDPGADLSQLPWPDADAWNASLVASPLVAAGKDSDGSAARPLRLDGVRLYLDRYWTEEQQVARDLTARAGQVVEGVDLDTLAGGLDRLFPPPLDSQPDLARMAAAAAVLGRLTVLAGGPGTGKTTTVARILALVHEQAIAQGDRPPRVGLAAPTGKAAARLAEAVHEEAGRLDIGADTRDRLRAVQASTLHRLLGWRPGSQSRFRHDRSDRLPHDVVIVDETSMLSLSHMARLLDAVRSDARLILVGDPRQLASVEAGAVLGDVVGPAVDGLRMSPARHRLNAVGAGAGTGVDVPGRDTDPGPAGIGDSIVVLERVHRFGGGIAELATAIGRGDSAGAVELLRSGRPDLGWVEAGAVEADLVAAAEAVVAAARAGQRAEAIESMGAMRVLCVHRRGPAGVAAWNERIERWLTASIPGYGSGGAWYLGRPLLITANDHETQLYNGDTGVIVIGDDGRPVAVFERRGVMWSVSPARLQAVETVHAMTVHKSQGSQFDEVVVVIPDVDGQIVTRELIYTAITRARSRVTLVGPESVLRAAIERPIERASGLRERLWGA